MTHTHVCISRFRAPGARLRVARLKPELVAQWSGIGSEYLPVKFEVANSRIPSKLARIWDNAETNTYRIIEMDTLPLIAAMQLEGVGPKKLLNVVDDLSDGKSQFAKVANRHWRCSVYAADRAWEQAQRLLEMCEKRDILPIAFSNQDQYPERLHVLRVANGKNGARDDRPPVVYVKGNIDAVHRPKPVVAIVGTRKPTDRGHRSAFKLGRIAATYGVPVVSGLAYGCDQRAHEGCIENKGTAIAVLAHGLDTIYPSKNKGLAKAILDMGGCWISEFPPGTPVQKWSFVQRDRLQSALSDVVVIAQTGVKGGTQHTIRFAREQGRQLACVVPEAEANHRVEEGNRKLLQDKNVERLAVPRDLKRMLDRL